MAREGEGAPRVSVHSRVAINIFSSSLALSSHYNDVGSHIKSNTTHSIDRHTARVKAGRCVDPHEAAAGAHSLDDAKYASGILTTMHACISYDTVYIHDAYDARSDMHTCGGAMPRAPSSTRFHGSAMSPRTVHADALNASMQMHNEY
jgi:hypothetical protein